MLKQAQNSPIPVEEQVAVIYAGINGFLDDVAVDDVKEFVVKLRSYLRTSVPQFITSIQTEKKLTPENEETLKKAIADLKA
jgi:F-type H+-transporting ATPase subunit alpha